MSAVQLDALGAGIFEGDDVAHSSGGSSAAVDVEIVIQSRSVSGRIGDEELRREW